MDTRKLIKLAGGLFVIVLVAVVVLGIKLFSDDGTQKKNTDIAIESGKLNGSEKDNAEEVKENTAAAQVSPEEKTDSGNTGLVDESINSEKTVVTIPDDTPKEETVPQTPVKEETKPEEKKPEENDTTQKEDENTKSTEEENPTQKVKSGKTVTIDRAVYIRDNANMESNKLATASPGQTFEFDTMAPAVYGWVAIVYEDAPKAYVSAAFCTVTDNETAE